MSLDRQTHVSVFLSPKVDIIMEDITDEINDLQQSINATNGEDEGAPRRPVDLECRVTDSMQVGIVSLGIFNAPDFGSAYPDFGAICF